MPLFIRGVYSDSSFILTGIGSISPTTSLLYLASSNSLTASNIYFTYFNTPTNTGMITTSSTIYIAGAPTGGTITNSYSLNVANGVARIGGGLKIPTGAINGYILTSDANGNASWISPSVSSFNGFVDGSVSAPGAYFISQSTTGFYKPGSGQIYVSLASTNTLRFSTTATTSLVSLNLTGIGSSTISSATAYINPASTPITGASIYYFTYLAAPITVPTTFTGTANTLFIAGAPTSTTGGTGYALNIASGNVILSGASSSLLLSNTSASTNSLTGALQIAGGAYFGANSLFAANLTVSLCMIFTGASSIMSLANTTSSTSSTTGALQVAGGASFGADTLFASNLTVSNIFLLSGTSSSLAISGTTVSTSSITGTLINAGGMGISKNLWLGSPFTGANASIVGSIFNIPAFTYTTSTSSPTNVNIASINQITLNGTGTTTNAASLYISGPPISGTQVITTPYALIIANGNSLFAGNVTVGFNSTLNRSLVANTTNSTVSLCGYNNIYFSKFLDAYNDTSNQRLKLSTASALTGLMGLLILNESPTTTGQPIAQLSLGKAYSIRDQIDLSFYYAGYGSTLNKLQFGYAGVAYDQFNIRADGSTNVTGFFTISNQPYYSVKGGGSLSISDSNFTDLTSTVWTGSQTSQGTDISYGSGIYTVYNSGIYIISATIYWLSTGGGERTAYINKNNGYGLCIQGSAGGSNGTFNNVFTVTKLSASDTIRITVVQTSGGNKTVGAYPPHEFTIYKLS